MFTKLALEKDELLKQGNLFPQEKQEQLKEIFTQLHDLQQHERVAQYLAACQEAIDELKELKVKLL